MGRDGQPFRLQLDNALMLDVQRRVDVPVVLCVAGGALPRPDVQRHGVHLVLADMAGLGAGKPRVNLDQMLALLPGLVVQLGHQGMPGRIADVLGEAGVFHHVADLQRLDDHRLIIVNDLSRELVLEVVAGIRQPLVRLGDE